MPIAGENTKIPEEGQEKDAFRVTFTNGALDQLNDFCQFYKQTDLTEVIKLAVSFLQKVKERTEEENEIKTP